VPTRRPNSCTSSVVERSDAIGFPHQGAVPRNILVPPTLQGAPTQPSRRYDLAMAVALLFTLLAILIAIVVIRAPSTVRTAESSRVIGTSEVPSGRCRSRISSKDPAVGFVSYFTLKKQM